MPTRKTEQTKPKVARPKREPEGKCSFRPKSDIDAINASDSIRYYSSIIHDRQENLGTSTVDWIPSCKKLTIKA